MSTLSENLPASSGEALIRKHLGMEASYNNWPACYQSLADELGELTLIGAMWKADSSLAKWFPMTAEALEEIRQVATGERQVGNDDTDGLDWIARRIAAINPPNDKSSATPEQQRGPRKRNWQRPPALAAAIC